MRSGLLVIVVLIASLACSVQAQAISQLVRNACRDDYHRFCKSYQVGSQELRQCMTRVGGSLSRGGIDALLQTGEISGREADLRNR